MIPTDVRPEKLFPPLGPGYERASTLLSLGLEGGWRRRLILRAAPREGDLYLDVATGTGLVARGLRRRGSRVIGLDLVPGMIGAAEPSDGVRFVLGRAEQLPFPDATFDGLTVTYLFRYVDDPVATLRELARVVRPGGRIAMLEFGRPGPWPIRLGWWLYTRLGLPLVGALVSRDWRDVGAFLGRSIDRFYERYDMDRVWRDAGIAGVACERLALGTAVVVSGARAGQDGAGSGPASRDGPGLGRRPDDRHPLQWGARATKAPDARLPSRDAAERPSPAFYALAPGGWRDYVTLLHLPYLAWHLSYVVLGAALAAEMRLDRLAVSLLAFFLALGVGIHALDEMNGRPLRTRIPGRVLLALALGGIGAAVLLGLAATTILGPGMLLFVAAGIALALGYPLELAGGRLHSDLWFAVGWGAFPVLTAAYASGGSLTLAAIAGAAYALALSYAQRVLSTWVRMLRRRTESAGGEIRLTTGETIALDRRRLIAAPESALRWLTAVSVLVALAAVSVRLL